MKKSQKEKKQKTRQEMMQVTRIQLNKVNIYIPTFFKKQLLQIASFANTDMKEGKAWIKTRKERRSRKGGAKI